MASYVILWENNTTGHRKAGGHTWPGHAALNIGDYFDFDGSFAQNYVSWWPAQAAAGFGVGDLVKSVFKKSQKGVNSPTFFHDIQVEGYYPDHVIELTTDTSRENWMKAEWMTVFVKQGGASYANLRKNCSTIVARVLHAGGFHAKKWAVDCNWVWTPADVRKLAEKVGGRRLTWDDFVRRVVKLSNETISSFCNVSQARSGLLCSTGAACRHQSDQRCVV